MIRCWIPLVLTLALTGCAVTVHTVPRTDLASVDAELREHETELHFASGKRTTGRILFVRPDSTAWVDDGVRQEVPTSEVHLIALDRRSRAVGRGLLIGAGVGLGLAALTLATTDDDPDDFVDVAESAFTTIAAVLLIPTGALAGAIVGGLSEERVEYRLAE